MRHVMNTVAALACTLGACTAEIENPATADDEAALDHIEALGYSRDSAAVEGDTVLVESDILFDRRLLLEGAYERPIEAHGGFIEKGYRYTSIISAIHQGNVRLRFATGAQAPSKTVRDGFIAAAKAWSSIPGSALRLSTENTGPAITIRMLSAREWVKAGAPCPGVDACANAPVNGKPGANLYIRVGSRAGDCVGWSGSNLASVTRHELGHALGFAHPEEADSEPVPDTKTCRLASEKACANDPHLYSTIMGPAEIQPGCSVTPARITKDDYATAKGTYPAEQ